MTKKNIIILIIIIIALIGGGYLWFSSQREGDIVVVEGGEENGQEAENGDNTENLELNTDDWLTYRNEEYGFEVKYPGEWSKDGELSYPIKLSIISFKESPIVLTPNDYAMTLTQNDILQLKKNIESLDDKNNNKIMINNNKTLAYRLVEYDVPGGNLYAMLEFFIGNDLIKLTVSLPGGPFSWPKDKQKIEGIKQSIITEKADADILLNYKKFIAVTETLKIK